MIALGAAQDLISLRLSDFDLILASEFECSLDGFRAAAGEIDSAAGEVWARKGEQFFGVSLGDGSGELAGVSELKLCGLPGHRCSDVRDAVSDEVDRSGAGEIEIAMASGVVDIGTLAAHGRGKLFAEGAAEDRGHKESINGRCRR